LIKCLKQKNRKEMSMDNNRVLFVEQDDEVGSLHGPERPEHWLL